MRRSSIKALNRSGLSQADPLIKIWYRIETYGERFVRRDNRRGSNRVPRSLWVLSWLQFRARFRKTVRGLRGGGKVLLNVLGALFLIGYFGFVAFANGSAPAASPEETRRGGTALLLFFLALNFFSTGRDKAVYFSRPEVDFLFPAPFSQRQLLIYKIFWSTASSFLSALFLAFLLRRGRTSYLACWLGLSFALMFVQHITLLSALIFHIIGEKLYNRSRKIIAAALVLIVATALGRAAGVDRGGAIEYAAAGSIERKIGDLDTRRGVSIEGAIPPRPGLFARAIDYPPARVALWPLRVFVEAYTAERLWPDLALWGGAALTLNLALLGLILAIDPRHFDLEYSAAASERIADRIERIRRGGLGSSATIRRKDSSRAPRLVAPMLPYFNGAGPIIWRQSTAALRGLGRLLFLVLIVTLAFGSSFWASSGGSAGGVDADPVASDRAAIALVSVVAFSGLILSRSFTFDFRGDFDRIPQLKALPIGDFWLVVGELFTPIALLTVLQATALVLITAATRPTGTAALALIVAFASLIPVNILLFSLENLVFLLMPSSRPARGSIGDFSQMGRQMLISFAKMLVILFTLALAFLGGYLGYLASHKNVLFGAACGWIVAAGFAIGSIPLIAAAFRGFDVAADAPDS